jgi:hypothetical protein
MAVTTEKSTQVTAVDDTEPPVYPEANEWHGRLRVARFTFTQGAAAGDATSTATLVKLPGGAVRILGHLSRIAFSAFGASRTLNIGYTANRDKAGAAVAADPDAFASSVDVSSAGTTTLAEALATTTDGTTLITSQAGFYIDCVVAGGTIPAAATINGYVVYVAEG